MELRDLLAKEIAELENQAEWPAEAIKELSGKTPDLIKF